MSIPVSISGYPGQYVAHLLGEPALSAVGPTREDALSGLRLVVQRKLEAGELTAVEFGSWLDLAGSYSDDETLDDLCREAYEARAAETGE